MDRARALSYLLYITCNVYLVICFNLEVIDVIKESNDINNIVYHINTSEYESESGLSDHSIAGGPVSIDCLRCLCLKLSNCRPIGCVMTGGTLSCGFFRITYAFWIDCWKPGDDWKTCSNNLQCASQCVQNYMERYAKKFNCFQNCEGFTREIAGGPNGCNNPRTVAYWEKVQKVPGCKGVQ